MVFVRGGVGRRQRTRALGLQHLHDPVGLDVAQWTLEKTIEKSIPPPPLDRVLDHVDHIVELVGVDHVGLGSDFDGMGAPPAGLEHVGKLPAITEALLKRGFSEPDVAKILGGNLLRVMAENEMRAKNLQADTAAAKP